MDLDLDDDRRPTPAAGRSRPAADRDEIGPGRRHWANWELELVRAADRDTLVIARTPTGSRPCARTT